MVNYGLGFGGVWEGRDPLFSGVVDVGLVAEKGRLVDLLRTLCGLSEVLLSGESRHQSVVG